MNAQKETYWFIFGGMTLILFGFDILTGIHYAYNLDGLIMLAALAVIALGSFLAFFCAWFSIKHDSGNLKVFAFIGKSALIIVGGLSAASIITLYFHEKAIANASQNELKQTAAKADSTIQVNKALTQSDLQRIQAVTDAAIKLKQTTNSITITKSFLNQNGNVVAAPTPTPEISVSEATQATIEKEQPKISGVKKWLLEYSQSGIYIVPVISNIFVFLGIGLALITNGFAKK